MTPAVMLFMGILIVAALAWALTLQRRLKEQTSIIVCRLQRIAALEKRYRDLFENANDIIYTLDLEGKLTSLNKAGEKLLGYRREQVWGKNISEMAAPECRHLPGQMLERKLAGETGIAYELVVLTKDGKPIPLEVSSRLIHQEGKPVGVQAIARDITERKQAQRELQKAKNAAEAASRAKSEFLAMMSHEIRTPMNGVIGMTELALETPLSSEQREYLQMAKSSADTLLTLINDILDFSKIEAGKIELESVEVDLRSGLASILKTLAWRAHEKDLELAYSIDPEGPGVVEGDPGRLRQVILNLVGNAIKFSERGEVMVRVETQSQDASGVLLHFSVADTGIGIPREKQEAIFEAFTQSDASTSRKYGGTGLGLTISARLVEMMGGRIWVESEIGKGSTFHFTARFGRSPALAHQDLRVDPSADGRNLRGMRVLVADDNATHRRILEEALSNWHMKPTLAAGGLPALTLMEEAKQARRTYPLVLMDAQMPDLDGFALAEKIQQDRGLAGATILMLASAGQRGDAARCRELGISAYLTKPLRPSDLLEAILAVLGKSMRPADRGGLVTRHSLGENRRRLRILLAEDNAVNQVLGVHLLERHGHGVEVAATGKQVLAALEKETEFDLVLMDVQMPEIDGFQATAAIREKEKSTGRHIPIIATTAHAMKGDRERCLAAGMDGYVSKPVQIEELLAAIERVAPVAVGRPGIRAGSGLGPTPSGPDQKVLDGAAVLARAKGDATLAGEIAELFLRDCPRLLSKIREAVEARDAKRLAMAAHTLRGSVSHFAARGASQAAMRLETMGLEGDWAHLETAYRALEEEIERLKLTLSRLSGMGKEVAQ